MHVPLELARHRAPAAPTAPFLDEDGLLRHAGRWVAISDCQLPLVELLLEHQGRVVGLTDLVDAYVSGGGTDRIPTVRTVLSRLNHRIRPVGLELRTIRRRGVLLQPRSDRSTSDNANRATNALHV